MRRVIIFAFIALALGAFSMAEWMLRPDPVEDVPFMPWAQMKAEMCAEDPSQVICTD